MLLLLPTPAMITEKQVEYVIIPMPNEHLVTVVPNITIIVLTTILIIFYVRQSAHLRRRVAETQHALSDMHSAASLPNLASSSFRTTFSDRSRSTTSFWTASHRSCSRTIRSAERVFRHLSHRLSSWQRVNQSEENEILCSITNMNVARSLW